MDITTKNSLIKIAYENPELRADLLPIITGFNKEAFLGPLLKKLLGSSWFKNGLITLVLAGTAANAIKSLQQGATIDGHKIPPMSMAEAEKLVDAVIKSAPANITRDIVYDIHKPHTHDQADMHMAQELNKGLKELDNPHLNAVKAAVSALSGSKQFPGNIHRDNLGNFVDIILALKRHDQRIVLELTRYLARPDTSVSQAQQIMKAISGGTVDKVLAELRTNENRGSQPTSVQVGPDLFMLPH